MKKLYFMRHGKAEWPSADIEDYNRVLKKRGKKASKFMGKQLLKFEELPDVILSSSADRAKQTIENFAKASGFGGPIQYEETLYMTTVEHALHRIQALDETYDSMMLVGHNPNLEEIIAYLISQADVQMQLPTCGVVCLEADIDQWQDLEEDSCMLKWFLIPRLFMK